MWAKLPQWTWNTTPQQLWQHNGHTLSQLDSRSYLSGWCYQRSTMWSIDINPAPNFTHFQKAFPHNYAFLPFQFSQTTTCSFLFSKHHPTWVLSYIVLPFIILYRLYTLLSKILKTELYISILCVDRLAVPFRGNASMIVRQNIASWRIHNNKSYHATQYSL